MGRILPWLATGWKIASDKKSITFTLRKGVKFHDGTDFNAEAAKWNMDQMKAKKKSGTSVWSSIDIIDDYTIRVNIKSFENSVLNNMTSNTTMISPSAFKTKGIDWVRWHPIATGPFKFVSFKRDVVTKYKRNENYWQKGKPYLDEIELQYVKDPMTQSAVIQRGEGDLLRTDSGKLAYDLKAKGFKVIHAPVGTLHIMPDSANPSSPLSDKRVRQAIELAIDREAIVKARGFGFWKTAYQIPPQGTIAYNPDLEKRAAKYNPEKAKKLLTDAGYPNGFKIKIIPHPRALDKDAVVAMQSQLGDVGIKVDIDFVTLGRFTQHRLKGWHNAALLDVVPNSPNYISGIGRIYSTKSPLYPSLKRSEEFKSALDAALKATDYETQKEMSKKVIRVMFDDLMIVPLYTFSRCIITKKSVYDTGWLTSGHLSQWRPDNAWMSK
ncbi:ABC transporter substrate-binding protein [Thermodesulfobacteriota bacterium]